jgi:hypothetical protein
MLAFSQNEGHTYTDRGREQVREYSSSWENLMIQKKWHKHFCPHPILLICDGGDLPMRLNKVSSHEDSSPLALCPAPYLPALVLGIVFSLRDPLLRS